MTLLPIVARELRVAARKRSTFWLRMAAALVALLIGCGFMVLNATLGAGTARLGGPLFGILTWLAMAAAVSGGLFFTADALSEEKREGTLGFLFLTDLRGYDVAAGKLLATSLRGSYALLAFFPVLAITLVMGGVTGGQFWKATFALVNALFCSLATGLFVSSISRDAQKAMAGTLLALFLLFAGGPIADRLHSLVQGNPFKAYLSLCSPAYVFGLAGDWGHPPYWLGLFLCWLCGVVLLAGACWLAPRTWQERGRGAFALSTAQSYGWRYGNSSHRAALRRELIPRNPVLWLTCRERWQRTGIWLLTGLALAGFALAVLLLPTFAWMIWSQCSGMVVLLVYLWLASQAGKFFIEARRSGLLELLLVTPLPAEDIVRGQWRALWRMFGLPLLLLLAMNLASAVLGQQAVGGLLTRAGGSWPSVFLSVVTESFRTVCVGANLLALSWFGMWMGLTSRNVGFATLKTLLFVQVIPWMVITFVSLIISAALMFSAKGLIAGSTTVSGTSGGVTTVSTTVGLTFPMVVAGVTAALTAVKDLCFIAWSRRKLYSSFRQQVVRSVSPVPSGLVPLPPRPPPVPPVIAAGS